MVPIIVFFDRDTFKVGLGKLLEQCPNSPPVTGYTPIWITELEDALDAVALSIHYQAPQNVQVKKKGRAVIIKAISLCPSVGVVTAGFTIGCGHYWYRLFSNYGREIRMT